MGRIIASFVLALLLIGAIAFVGTDIAARTSHIRAQRVERAFRMQAGRHLATLQQDYGRAKELMPALETRIPQFAKLAELENAVAAHASRVRLESAVLNIHDTTAPDNARAGRMRLTLMLEGTYARMIDFLAQLEGDSDHPIAFGWLELNRQDNGRTFGASFTGNVFFQ